ncbi:hypothetical protein KAI92_04140 [Candidatus Parcubacteria bacterium]|nr:hypothetical protein [Candidatus Parcubacteria bacterium]
MPCPQCLAERDENVRVIVEEMDRIFLVDEMLMAEMDEETATLKDLLPADHADWLIERIM